jgi:FkbH-like protein
MSSTILKLSSQMNDAVERGDKLRKTGDTNQAIEAYLAAALAVEIPPASLCLKLARSYERIGNYAEAYRWAMAVVDADDDFPAWQAAAALVQRCPTEDKPANRRAAKAAVVGSYTTTQWFPLLHLAAARLGVALDLYESYYGQYRQDIINPHSRMYTFAPDFVVLAVHEGDLALPEYSSSPDDEVETELRRWTRLWQTIGEHSKARVVQHNFVVPAEAPMGHLGSRLRGSRHMMTQTLNLRLGEEAGTKTSIVDCERLASLIGKQRWCDPRYWHLSKQAVALDALPLLARHTAAVIAADLGLSRKCLLLDLDNTLWGGIIGEDGLSGIKLGNGVEGEAFVTFQEYILKLRRKGVILAVCSKNNEADAKEPFEKHPEMRIKLDDIAIFIANWEPKPDNIRRIAKTLNIGLESLVLVDDNPVEREAIRRFLPEVDVVPLPPDPTQYSRALSGYLMFESSSFTPEDTQRTEQYRAMAQIAEMEAASGSLEDFYRSLRMEAIVAPFDEFHLPRTAQLIGKTNQFNLTTRRHGIPQLRAFMNDPDCVHFYLRLRDRFADHGLVSLIIALREGDILDIDTWLMSCRVIGRTVEAEMLKHVCQRAAAAGCHSIRGTYIPTAHNEIVKDIFGKFGFDPLNHTDGKIIWLYDIRRKGLITNEFIQTVDSWENLHDVACAT